MSETTKANYNLTHDFFSFAQRHPHAKALIETISWDPNGTYVERVWTFGEFASLVSKYRQLLDHEKIRPGDKVLVLLPVSARMYALVASLFANGVVPVFVDGTLSRHQFFAALRTANPSAVFSTRALLKYRFVLPALWGRRLYTFNESGLLLRSWEKDIKNETAPLAHPISLSSNHPGLITFTSGSTGRPKAADRRLSMLFQQREVSRRLWHNGHENDIELVAFPLVVFNNLSSGITSLLPALNYRKLDEIPVACWSHQIQAHQVHRLVVPPSILHGLSRQTNANEVFSGVRRLVTGGAPVPSWLMSRTQNLFPNSENHVVYGSTEAEPISHASFDEVLSSEGKGYLVGRPIDDIAVKIIATSLSGRSTPDLTSLSQGRIGEILVSGPHVVDRYLFNEEENQRTKLRDADRRIWHRTGDTGYFDERGRLWLTGRVSDRIDIGSAGEDVYPIEHRIENLFARRSALVQVPGKKPTLFIEGNEREATLLMELQAKIKLEQIKQDMVKAGENIQIIVTKQMPVDRRHFWKMDRQSLRARLHQEL